MLRSAFETPRLVLSTDPGMTVWEDNDALCHDNIGLVFPLPRFDDSSAPMTLLTQRLSTAHSMRRF